MRTYKIRKFTNSRSKSGEAYINYSLTIPSVIAEKLPEDIQFSCELTDEGILFKPSKAETDQVVLPGWANTKNGGGKPKAKTSGGRSRPRKRPSAAKKTAKKS